MRKWFLDHVLDSCNFIVILYCTVCFYFAIFFTVSYETDNMHVTVLNVNFTNERFFVYIYMERFKSFDFYLMIPQIILRQYF